MYLVSGSKSVPEVRWASCQQEEPAPTAGLRETCSWVGHMVPGEQVKETSCPAWGSKTHISSHQVVKEPHVRLAISDYLAQLSLIPVPGRAEPVGNSSIPGEGWCEERWDTGWKLPVIRHKEMQWNHTELDYTVKAWFIEYQFSLVTQSCPTLCDPMDYSTPGLPVHHQLPEFTQTHFHLVGDAIQPSHPLSSPSPPATNPS